MNLNKKNILITGGTGSFGKACVKHILKNYKPNKLVIFSRDELKQFEMLQELQDKKKNSCLRFCIVIVLVYSILMERIGEILEIIQTGNNKLIEITKHSVKLTNIILSKSKLIGT